MFPFRPALVILLALNTAGVFAAEILRSDFERGVELAKYAGLSIRGVQAAIVAGGPTGKGHCLRLRNAKPSSSCPLRLVGPIRMQKNLGRPPCPTDEACHAMPHSA